MKALEFRNVSKRFGNRQVLHNVSFSVDQNEFFSLLGPSGCGKTTLLRLVAGFDQPDSGSIILDGQDITRLPPHKRPVNTVFQNYALFPHLTVWDNIAFGLQVERLPAAEISARVQEMLDLIQMEPFADSMPHELSGGQKQRVAIARALIKRPQLLLLDEPLSALDLKMRQRMLFEIDLIQEQVGICFLFVTHDQKEAMAVSHRIALLHDGRVEQIGTPISLYEAPETSFVAAFIGDTNFFDGTVRKDLGNEYLEIELDGFGSIVCFDDKRLRVGDRVHLSLRPEKLHISRQEPEPQRHRNVRQGVVEDVVYQGDHTKYWVRADSHLVAVTQQHSRFLLDEKPIRWEEKVWLWWHADDGYMLQHYEAGDAQLTETPPEAIGEETQPEDIQEGDEAEF